MSVQQLVQQVDLPVDIDFQINSCPTNMRMLVIKKYEAQYPSEGPSKLELFLDGKLEFANEQQIEQTLLEIAAGLWAVIENHAASVYFNKMFMNPMYEWYKKGRPNFEM